MPYKIEGESSMLFSDLEMLPSDSWRLMFDGTGRGNEMPCPAADKARHVLIIENIYFLLCNTTELDHASVLS